MNVVQEEAGESYAEEIVQEIRSDEVEDLDANCERVKEWVKNWMSDQQYKKKKKSKE